MVAPIRPLERTPWFDARAHKPVRPGEYEYLGLDFVGMVQRWFWCGGHWISEGGFTMKPLRGDRWRGLTKEAK